MPREVKWAISLLVAWACCMLGWKFYFVLVTLHVIDLRRADRRDAAAKRRGCGPGGAFGGAGSQTAFGPRGAATFLSKATTWCAIMFMLTSMALTMHSEHRRRVGGQFRAAAVLEDRPSQAPPAPAPAAPAPVTPCLRRLLLFLRLHRLRRSIEVSVEPPRTQDSIAPILFVAIVGHARADAHPKVCEVPLNFGWSIIGAAERIRTSTVLLPPAPQAGASASSATTARAILSRLGAACQPCAQPATRKAVAASIAQV